MWKKIKDTAVIVLATLGVLFIILMLLPDTEDDKEPDQTAVEAEADNSSETGSYENDTGENSADENGASTEGTIENEADENGASTEGTIENEAPENSSSNDPSDEKEASPDTASVEIPASVISDYQMDFKTTTLDGKKVTDDIFSDYDLTLVHCWGTFCGPCIAEMGDYGRFYRELPDNVNLVGIITDVYDGLDNNVDAAEEILGNADAGFMNLRTSDSIFEVTESIRFIPSSFLVDREGHLVGELLEGAHFDDSVKELKKYVK